MAIQVSRRYECEVCGTEVVAMRGSDAGVLRCCDRDMGVKKAAAVASAD